MEYFCMHCQQNAEVSIYDEITRCLNCRQEIEKLAIAPKEYTSSDGATVQNDESFDPFFDSRELDMPTRSNFVTTDRSPVRQFSNIRPRQRVSGIRSTSTPPGANSLPDDGLRASFNSHPYANSLRVRRLAISSPQSLPSTLRNYDTRSSRRFILPEPTNRQAESAQGSVSQVIIRFDGNGYAFRSRGVVHFTEAEIHQIVHHAINNLLGHVGEDEPAGISSEHLAHLPMLEVSEKQVEVAAQCVTCMENFKVKEKVAILDCEHIYHQECIVPWLKRHTTCPLCRRVVDPKKWPVAGNKKADEIVKKDRSKERIQSH